MNPGAEAKASPNRACSGSRRRKPLEQPAMLFGLDPKPGELPMARLKLG